MKRIISLLVVMAMMLATVLAIIPVAATTPVEDNDVVVENNAADDGAGDAATEETPAEVTRFLPDGLIDEIKAIYEVDGASTSEYVPSVAPFVNYDASARTAFAGKRLLKIWVPVKTAKAVDENGDLFFTLSVVTVADLYAAPVKTYSIKVNAEKYGITPNTTVHKMIEVNLVDYEIVVGEGQTIALGGSDTALLAWASGSATAIVNALKDGGANYALKFNPNAGKAGFKPDEAWNDTAIFYDVEMIDADAEVPVEYYGTPINSVEDLKAIENGKSYVLNADLELPADWAPIAFANGAIYGNGHTITLTGANGLFAEVTNATLANFTLAGEVLTGEADKSGVATVVSGVTFKDVTVAINTINAVSTKYVGDDGKDKYTHYSAGAFALEAKGDVTFVDCVNKSNITCGANAGFIAKLVYGNIVAKNVVNEGNMTANNVGLVGQANNRPADKVSTINVDTYTNKGYLKGSTTAGIVLGYNCGNNVYKIDIKSATNLGTVEAPWCGGLIGAQHTKVAKDADGKVTANVVINITDCVNGSKDDATLGKILGGGTAGGGYIGEAYESTFVVNGGANYAAIKGHNAGAILGKSSHASFTVKNFHNYANITGTLTGGGFAGWPTGGTFVIEDSTSVGNVNAQYAAGIVGACHTANATFKNVTAGSADKAYTVTGTSFAAGFTGEQNGNVTFINCVNYTTVTGGGGTIGGGFVGQLNGGGTAKFEKCVNNAKDHKVSGAWNKIGGGFLGTANNAGSSFYFVDCVNNASFNFDGNNFGGFLGGHQDCLAYKNISFIRCTNNGNITSTGNIGGFLGQGGGQNYYFEDCVNNGDIHSKSNLAGMFFGWGGGNGTVTAIRCYNYGDIIVNKHASQLNKKAAGFCAGRGVVLTMTDCVNFGNISSDEGDAAGFAIDATSTTLIRCYNVGNVKAGVYQGTARNRYEFASGAVTLRDCMVTNFHADIIEKVKALPLYKDIYDKTDYPAVVAAVNAATAVYDKADATDEDKAAAIAAVDKAIADLASWMEVAPDAAAVGGVINVTADGINAEGKDWIALVKKGEDVATVWAYLTDVKAAENGFNILKGTLGEGKTIVEGNYVLYFIPNGATVASVLAGEVEALATKDIVISGKAINTAEEFIAMEETGDYILGSDIVLPTDYVSAPWADNQWSNLRIFKGTLDGHGHSITLQTNNSLFYKLDGATIKNLTLEGGKLEGGLTHLVAGTVNFENVDVMIGSITRGWGGIGPDEKTGYKPLLGAFVDVVTDADVVVNFYDCVANTSIQADAYAGGFVGHASAGQVNFYGCTSGTVSGQAGCASGTAKGLVIGYRPIVGRH